jgi:hypothetical protein
MAQKTNRAWTTVYDRQNHRMLLLAGPRADDSYWAQIKHDPTVSLPGIYDIWRIEDGDDIVFVQIHLDNADVPRGFPRDLLDIDTRISPTIWCVPNSISAIGWYKQE